MPAFLKENTATPEGVGVPGNGTTRAEPVVITPFPWFDGKAEEAANFYVSIFKNSRVLGITRYGDAGPGPPGSVMTVSFLLGRSAIYRAQRRSALHVHAGISFVVNCDTPAEVTSSGRS